VSIKSLDAGGIAYGVKLSDYLDRNAGREPEPTPPPAAEAPPLAAPPPVEWTGSRPASSGAGLERRLNLSDLHIPFHSVRACAVVIAVAKAIQPHAINVLGDLFNMGAVSHHPRPFGGRENHRGAQVQGCCFMDALGRAAPLARKRLFLGNHDDWATEYEDEHPEFAGLLAAQHLGLDKMGWEIVPRCRQPFVDGPIGYSHGTGGGEHFAKRYALHTAPQAGVKHYRVGHHHRCVRFRAKNGVEVVSTPWLGDPRASAFDYAPDKGDWEVGATIDDVIGEHVTCTPVLVENGAALFGGRLITLERAA
jgi:hypothetical protein